LPKQNVGVELYYSGSWHDIAATNDVYADTPITITRGQGDESAALRPAKISMSLANDDDTYRTSNPVSPLYGIAGRNTPMRVKVGGTVRGTAEASSWAPDQTQDFRRPRRAAGRGPTSRPAACCSGSGSGRSRCGRRSTPTTPP
jgi:hypothetical protein